MIQPTPKSQPANKNNMNIDQHQLEHGSTVISLEATIHIAEFIRRKLTHALGRSITPGDDTVILDDEWEYDVPDVDQSFQLGTSNQAAPEPSRFPFSAIASTGNCNRQLILKILKDVGRANIYRLRERYFVTFNETPTPAEALERSQRSEEANARKARRSAADEALRSSCRTWTTLTFDDAHRTDRPQTAFRSFLRRLRERYERKTGKPLKYVAVIAHDEYGREHAHLLLSHDVEPQDIQESWNHGHISDITTIEESEIEEKVGYMAKNIKYGRVTFARFIRSRTQHDPGELIPVDDVCDARKTLEDLIHPHIPRVVQSRLFGFFTSVSFRFPPIPNEETE
jgi:hypothetical protein